MFFEITGQSGSVSVGEKITLGIRYTVSWGVLKKVEWTIPGVIVGNYQLIGANIARVTKIKEADRKKPVIMFYWVDGGDGRTVKATCTFTSTFGEITKTVTASFDVKAPTLDKFAATTDRVRIYGSSVKRAGFGEGAVTPGIKWDWKVTVPVAGKIKDVQTIKIDNTYIATDGKKKVRAKPGTTSANPDYLIDTSTCHCYTENLYPPCPELPIDLNAGDSFSDNITFDSPSNPLSGYKSVTIDRYFKYYIMFKSSKADSIWVPVAKAEWECRGKAVLDQTAGTWSLESPSGGITFPGARTTEFPQYESNSALHVPVEVP